MMKFDIFLLPTVPGTMEDRERLRPIGRNRERVQEMYEEVKRIAKLADDFGFDVFSTTEHHFHSEGFEVSTSPLILYSHLAALCPRIWFAPLAMVMTTWDPIRAAEEVAILDHLTKGRVIVGVARGYQMRWTNVLGQKNRVRGATMDGSAIDEQNREVFEENVEVMKKAWTEESFSHNGKYYQAPFPAEGIEGWPVTELTRRYGAPGELDSEGRIKEISVCPAPYQTPHPKMWQPFAASESTVKRCAERDILPWIFISEPATFNAWCKTYQGIAAAAGRNLALGQGVGAVRSVTIGATREEAFELGVRTTGATYLHYFGPFGFLEPFRREGDNPARPLKLGDERDVFQRLAENRYAIYGTVDDVLREMESLAVCHGDGVLEWFSWNFFFQGLTSMDEQERQLELFATKVMPRFQ